MAIPLPLPPPLPLLVALCLAEGGTCAALSDALVPPLVGLVLAVCLEPADGLVSAEDLVSVEDFVSTEDFVSAACWGASLGLAEAWSLVTFAEVVLALGALEPALLRRRERLFLAA
ncbi:hypothetical protein HVE01_05870 [Vreelandella venusta]|nr:hypothetical protein HVE01_05870 [Halomonas venusta]